MHLTKSLVYTFLKKPLTFNMKESVSLSGSPPRMTVLLVIVLVFIIFVLLLLMSMLTLSLEALSSSVSVYGCVIGEPGRLRSPNRQTHVYLMLFYLGMPLPELGVTTCLCYTT